MHGTPPLPFTHRHALVRVFVGFGGGWRLGGCAVLSAPRRRVCRPFYRLMHTWARWRCSAVRALGCASIRPSLRLLSPSARSACLAKEERTDSGLGVLEKGARGEGDEGERGELE